MSGNRLPFVWLPPWSFPLGTLERFVVLRRSPPSACFTEERSNSDIVSFLLAELKLLVSVRFWMSGSSESEGDILDVSFLLLRGGLLAAPPAAACATS